MLSTREVAERLNTSPKVVRQFFRADDTFGGVGSGARYAVNEKDMPRLAKRFEVWSEGKAVTTTNEVPDRPGLPVARLSGTLTTSQRAERDRLTRERVDRLEASLKERGLHISQMQR